MHRQSTGISQAMAKGYLPAMLILGLKNKSHFKIESENVILRRDLKSHSVQLTSETRISIHPSQMVGSPCLVPNVIVKGVLDEYMPSLKSQVLSRNR